MAPKLEQLHITVVEAKNLATMDRSGTSDPYVTLKNSFNKQHYKTKVQKKNLSPRWEQTFSFFLYGTAEGTVQLKVMDHDLFTRDELMGDVVLSLADYADGKEVEKWFVLGNEPQKKKKTPEKGELKLKLRFDVTPNPEDTKKVEAPKGKEEVAHKTEKVVEEKKEEKPSKPVSIEEKYDLGKVIGRGAFSEVKEGIRKQNGKRYAVKCISKKLIDKKELALLEREIDIMKKLQHPNIIQLMEVVDTQDTLYLILEYASGGELFDAIVNKGFYSEADAAKIVKQILEAIKYVHNHGIAHRDLKPENLLLIKAEDGTSEVIKIADFGLSKDFGEEQLQTSCGTPDYVAPEVLLGEPYDMAVDVWSIGVIAYVLLCGFPPFYGDSQKELFENIMNGRFDFPDPEWSQVSDAAKDFIKRILVVDAEKRATAEQCLEDPWLKEFTAPKKEIKRLETFSVQKFKEYTKKYKEQNPNAV
eukprot:TRINITY_DN698_c0_g1_i1.p2 TRINITY_DN698_c0_g1~~TRINITY_DN698_c0_g1_i1.p2  ORF type:complete len:473 (-),score=155.45 TRINITY_DN698_c0_g1_i1:514-1932(-)